MALTHFGVEVASGFLWIFSGQFEKYVNGEGGVQISRI